MDRIIQSLKSVRGLRGILYRAGEAQTRAAFAARGLVNFARLRSGRNGSSRPQVAAVVVGRNDDYMPDFAARLRATIEWNVRYLTDEVVFVEWNPPPDRDLLSYELTREFAGLRAYVVPPEVHRAMCLNDRVQLLEYHAKNVGIRRARAPWILATNADAALAPDTVYKLLHTPLDENVAWTAERVDIAWRENRQTRLGVLGSLRYRRMIPYHQLGTGEFILASKQLWHRTRGYDERMMRHRIGCDVRGTAQMLACGAGIERVGTVLHLAHPTSCTENIQPHHGEQATIEGVPYQNGTDWGLGDSLEVQLAENVWRLEPQGPISLESVSTRGVDEK